MHGNEVLGRELLLHMANYLCDRYLASDPDIQKLINLTRIHLLPSMNPDGWQVSTDTVSSNFCLKSLHSYPRSVEGYRPEMTTKVKFKNKIMDPYISSRFLTRECYYVLLFLQHRRNFFHTLSKIPHKFFGLSHGEV